MYAFGLLVNRSVACASLGQCADVQKFCNMYLQHLVLVEFCFAPQNQGSSIQYNTAHQIQHLFNYNMSIA